MSVIRRVGVALLAAFQRVVDDIRVLSAAWQTFWFRPESGETVSLLRLLVGSLSVYSVAAWTPRLTEFFSDDGFQSLDAVRALAGGSPSWSFWWFVPDGLLWPVHLASVSVLLCYAAGFWTAGTSRLAPVIVISYAHRVPAATFGLDQILGFLTLYLAISDCGSFYSLDRRFWRRDGPSDGRITRNRLARRLIQVQLCVLYTYAGIAKLKGTAWWEGTAVWRAIANAEYQSLDLTWLAWYPRVTEALTHGTVLWESTFWALVWHRRLRPYVLAGGVLMHLGIGAFLGMWTFGLAMIAAYVAFLDPEPAGEDEAPDVDVATPRAEVPAVSPAVWHDAVADGPPIDWTGGTRLQALYVDRDWILRDKMLPVLAKLKLDVTPVAGLMEAVAYRKRAAVHVLIAREKGLRTEEAGAVRQIVAAGGPTVTCLIASSSSDADAESADVVVSPPVSVKQLRAGIQKSLRRKAIDSDKSPSPTETAG